jgi:hypothetical protein
LQRNAREHQRGSEPPDAQPVCGPASACHGGIILSYLSPSAHIPLYVEWSTGEWYAGDMATMFTTVFVATVVVTRLFCWVRPVPSPTIGTVRLHHYMYGVAAMAASLAIGSIVLYALGLGLFVDELTFLVLRGRDHHDNYSLPSLVGTGLLVLATVLARHAIIGPFLR